MLLIVLLLVSESALPQSRVTYKIISKDTPVAGESEWITKAREIAENFELRLDVNDGKAHFYIVDDMPLDEGNAQFYRSMALMNVGAAEFWIDKPSSRQVIKTSEGKIVEFDLIVPDWTITSEMKKIDKYDCFRAYFVFNYVSAGGAEGSRKISAWFAPELPYTFGPGKFFGLPGLILELDDDFMTVFIATSVKTDIEIPKINLPETTMDQAEYQKGIRESRDILNRRK